MTLAEALEALRHAAAPLAQVLRAVQEDPIYAVGAAAVGAGGVLVKMLVDSQAKARARRESAAAEQDRARAAAERERERIAAAETKKAVDDTLARMTARLDQMQDVLVAGGAAPLGAESTTRRNQAAAAIATEATPAADAAAEAIAAGDIAGAIATLERDARADASAAADKWRRIGDLVLGVNTAEALRAFEEAFKLQPGDFRTAIELGRLRREAGNLDGARTAAQAARLAARDDRERSVAADDLGNVLREAGDLAGAKTRYEESLAVRERLARDNPGSAQAQRDLSISFNKLGDVLALSGDLAGAVARYEQSAPIARAIAASNPSHPGLQRDLAITEARLVKLRAQLAG